jgi:uncharacterized Zn finger protein
MAEDEPPNPDPVGPGRVAAGTLFCPNCGQDTAHRILRLREPGGRGDLAGVARCKVCRFTHPFEVRETRTVRRPVIVSDGAGSRRSDVEMDPTTHLEVGGRVPGTRDPIEIRRLDRQGGRPTDAAPASQVATIWAVRDRGAVVPVSIVEGDRTRPARVQLLPGTILEVDAPLVVEGAETTIVGLRAEGRTWRRPGDRFPAERVDRAYVRRSSIPPAGRSAWTRSRERPSSAARPRSTSDRSRSAPGTRVSRSSPRARSAEGGAADQSCSPA